MVFIACLICALGCMSIGYIFGKMEGWRSAMAEARAEIMWGLPYSHAKVNLLETLRKK